MARLAGILTVQNAGIADDNIALLDIVKLVVDHVAPLPAVHIIELEKVFMCMRENGVFGAVIFGN